MPPRGAPTGPRAARQSTRQGASRQPTRGGIQKRGATPLRADRDGDLDMVEAATRGGRNEQSGQGKSIRGAASNRQGTPESGSRPRGRPRTGIDPTAVQRAVLRQMGSDDRIATNSRLRTAHTPREVKGSLERLKIRGLRESKAASNRDGGIGDLLAFLERKATHADEEPVKIEKSRMEGDHVLVFAKSSDAIRILKLNGFTFAGAILSVEGSEKVGNAIKPPHSENDTKVEGANTISVLKDFLGLRYNPSSKLLDLSQTGADPQLNSIGMFKTTTTGSKFFPALMKVCDGVFTSAQEKEEAVLSVSLANNALPNITAVTTLAQTFPDLRNLDLSNNKIRDLKDMEIWRWKFRKLQNIVLSGNPIDTANAETWKELLKWYPELLSIDGSQVRTQEEVEYSKGTKLPLSTLAPSFRDEGAVAENFLKQYFLGFDADRVALAHAYYDQISSFSLNINVSAPRKTDGNVAAPSKWDNFIRRSRNLLKLSSPTAKKERLFTGVESISDCFKALPPTKHPDLLSEPQKWCIECNTIPGLPDASGQVAAGVGGLLIIVHGEFYESDSTGGSVAATRSFDRTFILGPGNGLGGVRVICDSLGLRSHGGSEAWVPEDRGGPIMATTQPITQPLASAASSGLVNDGKTLEQAQKEAIAIDLSTLTRMNLEYSAMCLEQSGWDLQNASARFEEVKSSLPPNAFI